MAYRHQQPLLLHSSIHREPADWHQKRLKHGQSSPDLIFSGNSGIHPFQQLPQNITNKASEGGRNIRHFDSRYSTSSMHNPKRSFQQTLIDRRLSLPESSMNVDLQIVPQTAILQNDAFLEQAAQIGRSPTTGIEVNESDARQSKFSPSLLESQV